MFMLQKDFYSFAVDSNRDCDGNGVCEREKFQDHGTWCGTRNDF